MAGALIDPVALELNRIWELTGLRRPTEALAAVAALAVRLPEHRDLLYLQAVSLRILARVPAALAALGQLERLHPRSSLLYQERGQCYLVLRDGPKALDAFQQAVRINSALPVSWQMLQRLYQATGEAAHAAMAAQHLATLEQLPPEIIEANSLLTDGYLLPAESLIRAYLKKDGNNVGALRLLARIGLERGALEEAESLLASVLRLAPDFHAARLEIGRAHV